MTAAPAVPWFAGHGRRMRKGRPLPRHPQAVAHGDGRRLRRPDRARSCHPAGSRLRCRVACPARADCPPWHPITAAWVRVLHLAFLTDARSSPGPRCCVAEGPADACPYRVAPLQRYNSTASQGYTLTALRSCPAGRPLRAVPYSPPPAAPRTRRGRFRPCRVTVTDATRRRPAAWFAEWCQPSGPASRPQGP